MRTLFLFAVSFLGCLRAQGQQETLLPFPSAREVRPSVHASVVANPTGFDYRFDVGNSTGAQQPIEFFFVIIGNSTVQSKSIPENWDQATWIINTIRAVDWGSILPTANIQPGQPVVRFAVGSSFLPGIVSAHAGGTIGSDTLGDEPNYDLTNADIIHNSVEVMTVGPKYSGAQLTVLSLPDTLGALVTQANSLGWIPAQATSVKYMDLFSRIRSDILQDSLKIARTRIDSVLQETVLDSASNITSEAYALIRFNTECLRDKLQPSPDVKGVIFNSSRFDSLIVRAKPDTAFSTGDTLMSIMATVRWPSQFAITLGNVTSSFGFAKAGAPATLGGYIYQKFQTTTHTSISWQAGQEYTLFSVPVNGTCGAETFELTNALSGGEWFVDINYLDKTDTTFYAPVARGFAFLNKVDNSGSTAFNGARHVATHGRTFHEVYHGANEILYRRKNLDSTTWQQTLRLSRGNGSNSDANIIVAHDGSVHVVWQRMLTSSAFDLWYRRSTNGGTTWSADTTLATSITINQSSQWNIYPVIAEDGTTRLMVVYCFSGGMKYTTSSDLGASWTAPATVPNTTLNYIWYPSLAAGSNFLILTYDTRTSGIYSKMYNGSWQGEVNLKNGISTTNDRCSSVVVDATNAPMAVWCAQRSGQAEYRIVYRSGAVGGGSWSSAYTEFPYTSTISDYYPSIAYVARSGVNMNGMEVLWYNSRNEVKLRKYYASTGWNSITRLDTAANWANFSIQESGSTNAPMRMWTNFATASPYDVKLACDTVYQVEPPNPEGLIGPPGAEDFGEELSRRITVESEASKSFVSYELAPIKVVTSMGDTTVLPFKTVDQRHAFSATVPSAWDYLGTAQVTLPTNARSLVLDASVETVVREDSLGTKGTNGFDASGLQVQLIGKDSKTYTVLSEAAAKGGRKVINIANWAGEAVTVRVAETVSLKAKSETPQVGIGDIYRRRTQ
jgi:hypothetical protein